MQLKQKKIEMVGIDSQLKKIEDVINLNGRCVNYETGRDVFVKCQKV